MEETVRKQTVFVAILLPNHDGSGNAKVLGAYSVKWKAEGRCYRELKSLGYDQPTDVVECQIDQDILDPPPDPARVQKIW